MLLLLVQVLEEVNELIVSVHKLAVKQKLAVVSRVNDGLLAHEALVYRYEPDASFLVEEEVHVHLVDLEVAMNQHELDDVLGKVLSLELQILVMHIHIYKS